MGSFIVAGLLIAAFAPRSKGEVTMSRYFKAGDRCMVKPFDDLPAQQIPCDQWDREVEAERKGLIGG